MLIQSEGGKFMMKKKSLNHRQDKSRNECKYFN